MKKKKKNNKKKLITIISIIVISIGLISVSLLLHFNNTFLKDTAMIIEKIIMYPFTALNKEKNESQSESYLIQKNINSSLEKEIQELKDALELNKTLTEYVPVNSTILSRNKSYWFNTITIDKGKSSGIKKSMMRLVQARLMAKT